jgi:CBS domain containing-hemolysin-like protein
MNEAIGIISYIAICIVSYIVFYYPLIWLWNAIKYLNKKMFEDKEDETDI